MVVLVARYQTFVVRNKKNMARRRMFSLDIVDTDAFLDMSTSAQSLYFHLGMRADDDGFVSNPKRIMRMCGSAEDDLKVLMAKRFVLTFPSGIVVMKHWKINNYIQADRYKQTVYLEEKNTLETKDNLSYTECIQNASNVDTQVRLGKDRLGKVSIGKDKEVFGEHNNISLSKDELEKLIDLLGEDNTNTLIEELSDYLASTGKRYKSHYATLRNWARRKSKEFNKNKKGKDIIGM